MKQEMRHRRSEPDSKAWAPDRIDHRRMSEHAREIRARYMRQFIKGTVSALVRFARGYKNSPVRITDSGGNVTSARELLVPSHQRAYRG